MIELLSTDLLEDPQIQCINEKLADIYAKAYDPVSANTLFRQLGGWHYVLDYSWTAQNLFWLVSLKNLGKDFKDTCILDAGCGKGVFQIYLASLGFNMRTVDKWPEIASWSLEKEKQFGVKLNFSSQDLSKLNFEDNCFDFIVSPSSLEHNTMENAKKVLDELCRVLKPGGCLIATLITKKVSEVWHKPPTDPVMTAYSEKDLKSVWGGNSQMRFLDSSSNYDQYDEIAKKIFATYKQGYFQTKQFLPIGIILEKV